MKRIFNIIVVIILSGLACDDNIFINDCLNCISTEPINATVEIKLDVDISNFTLISIYKGDLEDNILLQQTEVAGTPALNYTLVLNQHYTITALYTDRNDNKYLVVDSIFPRVRNDEKQCGEPCYFVYDNKITLKLKYDRRYM